jgi:hypothetical protein
VMTWSWGEAGAASDVLAGRVARAALRRFSEVAGRRPDPHAWLIQS